MSRTPESRERKAVIAFVVLAAGLVGLVVALVRLGGDDGDQNHAGARSTVDDTVAITTTTTAPAISYQVQRGDTLTSIARQFGVSVGTIVTANQLADQDQLVEGQILVIPPKPPVGLTVTPAAISAGGTVELALTGAQPSELVTFEITSPTGTFTGSPHTAPPDGTVTTTYTPARDAAAGTYTVVARGNENTTAQAVFSVRAASSL